MSEGRDAMSRHRLRHLVRLFRVLEGLPRTLVSRRVFLLPLFFTGTMGVGGKVVQFSGPLMVFVMRSVVISSRHIEWTYRVDFFSCLQLERFDLPGFGVGFLGKLIGAIGILKGAFRMPVTGLVVAFFVVLGSGAMGVSGKLVLFRGSPVTRVHGGVLSCARTASGAVLMIPETATTGGEAIEYRVRA
jgi:hypothetical protein